MTKELPNISLGINDKNEVVGLEQKEEPPTIVHTGRSGMGMTLLSEI